MEYAVIDPNVVAETLTPGDFVRVQGVVGKVKSKDENPDDTVTLFIEDVDEDDITEVTVEWDYRAELLDYDYAGVEV